MKRRIPVLIALSISVSACSGSDTPSADVEPRLDARVETSAAVATTGLNSTSTTALASSTTETTTTTAAPTTTTTTTTAPLRPIEDIALSGDGPDVVRLGAPFERTALALVTYEGDGTFEVALLDETGSRVDGFQGTSGVYSGTQLVNASGDEPFVFVEVEARGPWTITIADPSNAIEMSSEIGSVVDGAGEAVLLFETDVPRVVAFECSQCVSDVLVRSWSEAGRETIIEESGPYDGRQLIPAGEHLIEITTSSSSESPAWTFRVDE